MTQYTRDTIILVICLLSYLFGGIVVIAAFIQENLVLGLLGIAIAFIGRSLAVSEKNKLR